MIKKIPVLLQDKNRVNLTESKVITKSKKSCALLSSKNIDSHNIVSYNQHSKDYHENNKYIY